MKYKELAEFLEKENNPYLKLVRETRPYRIPKGYMRWDYLSAVIALMCDQYQRKKAYDRASWLNCVCIALWFVKDAPIYLISKDLLRTLEHTDVLDKPKMLKEILPVVSTFMLMFPENSIKTPDGAYQDYCIVHLSDRSHPEFSIGEFGSIKVLYLKHEHHRNLHWSSIFSNETCMVSGMGLGADGAIAVSEESFGADPISAEEIEFLARMRNLVLQVLLLLQYKPELITAEVPVKPHLKKHEARNKQELLQYRTPKWLGKDYKPRNAPKRGTHASPRSHPRNGFMRLQPYGKGRTEHKLIMVEPTWVNL